MSAKALEIDTDNGLYKPFEKQVLAHCAKERYILYGGAVGGGKSGWLVNEGLRLSGKYPGNIGYLCRHELTSFRRTTLLELEKFINWEAVAQYHQTECFFRFKNGSLIFYGGLGDDERAIDRLKSMTLGWFGIDQAEETSEQHFFLLASRLRLALPGIKYRGLLTANPAPGWVKNRFIEQKLEDHIFIPALPRDNPKLPSDYEDNLRKIYPEELIRALLEGDWDVLEAGNYLFRYADIRNAIDREFNVDSEGKVLGVDIARFGDDSSVAAIRQGQKVIWLENWAKSDLMNTTGRIADLIHRFTPSSTNVDVIGIGAGVVDRLREQKFKVNGVNVAEAAIDKQHYINLRSEIYASLNKRFQDGEISIPNDLELVAQLSSIKYKFASDGRMQIESKEDAKKRGIKSPDKADALALAFMEVKYTPAQIIWV